jgi:hypothetical protein
MGKLGARYARGMYGSDQQSNIRDWLYLGQTISGGMASMAMPGS